VGLKLVGRQIARHGHEVLDRADHRRVGVVTSGAPSPTLGVPIAMAYVPVADADVGTMVEIAIRGTPVDAEVVPLPFYKRSRG
jgi:aminomethyltransferase